MIIQYKKWLVQFAEKIGIEKKLKGPPFQADIMLELDLLMCEKEVKDYDKPRNSICLLVPNFLIDLSRSEDEIFQKMHRSTKYEINKARRDGLLVVELDSPTDEQITRFSEFYDTFAKELKIPKCDRNRLKALRDKGSLVISYVMDHSDQILCSTAMILTEKQAFGLYSASGRFQQHDSKSRNNIGRANRYLHWKNIQNAKKKGLQWYNFGLNFTDSQDQQGQNINKFKKSFGPLQGYDFRRYSSHSFKGKVILILFYINWRFRRKKDYKYTQNLMRGKLQRT